MKINKIDNSVMLLLVGLVAFAVLSRVLPHPPNFTPVGAVALFGGAVLSRRKALFLPLIVMIISDLVIGLHPLVIYTWGSFAVIALASSYKFKNLTAGNLVGASLASSLLFFLVTNFAVWAEGRMYAMTFSGLMQCYYNALPFLRGTLLGDLAYSGLLFGLYAVAMVSMRHKTAQTA